MSRAIRHSSRLIAKQNQVSTIVVKASPPRPNKRQKTKPQKDVPAKPSVPRVDNFRRVKGRKGKLRIMTEIPVDTLLEIFSHVEPLDLLHLSWATKDLHALITASRNSFLWTRVRMLFRSNSTPLTPPRPRSMRISRANDLPHVRPERTSFNILIFSSAVFVRSALT